MIHVYDNWYIDADERCYSLGKLVKRKDKDGNIVEMLSGQTYHATVYQALTSILRIEQRNITANSSLELKEAVKAFAELENAIGKLLPIKERIDE